MNLKDEWDLKSAMQVLEHKTVDSKLWAEAVEWLILYGPPEIQKLLLQASAQATESSFPELKPSHYTDDGLPYYDIAALAVELGTTEEEIRATIAQKETAHSEKKNVFQSAKPTIH